MFTFPVVKIKSGNQQKIPYQTPKALPKYAKVTLSGFKSPQHRHMQRYAEIESSLQLELTQGPGSKALAMNEFDLPEATEGQKELPGAIVIHVHPPPSVLVSDMSDKTLSSQYHVISPG